MKDRVFEQKKGFKYDSRMIWCIFMCWFSANLCFDLGCFYDRFLCLILWNYFLF